MPYLITIGALALIIIVVYRAVGALDLKQDGSKNVKSGRRKLGRLTSR